MRGACCLRPGVKGLSDNIQVRSIVGQFLEHARVYYFYHQGEELMYLASADWMSRNLHHRVEIAYPILDPEIKRRLKQEVFRYAMQDNEQAWRLLASGGYRRIKARGQRTFNAQAALLARYTKHKGKI